jgi:hypothetical protein
MIPMPPLSHVLLPIAAVLLYLLLAQLGLNALEAIDEGDPEPRRKASFIRSTFAMRTLVALLTFYVGLVASLRYPFGFPFHHGEQINSAFLLLLGATFCAAETFTFLRARLSAAPRPLVVLWRAAPVWFALFAIVMLAVALPAFAAVALSIPPAFVIVANYVGHAFRDYTDAPLPFPLRAFPFEIPEPEAGE